MSGSRDIVLFDFFGTLGSELAASPTDRLRDFRVFPSARRIVERLRERVRIGVFSGDPEVPGDRLRKLLKQRGLIPPIEPELVRVASGGEDAIVRLLRELRLEAPTAVFVSLDARQRARALDAGLRVAPHPVLVEEVLDGQPLRLVRLSSPVIHKNFEWKDLMDELAAVPVLLTQEEEAVAYAIASQRRLEALAASESSGSVGLQLVGDPDLVAKTTLFLLQFTREQVQADVALGAFVESLERRGLPLVRETPNGWLVALPADHAVDELHPPPAGAGHGHSRVLLPDRSVLGAGRTSGNELRGRALDGREKKLLASLTATDIRKKMESWLRGGAPR